MLYWVQPGKGSENAIPSPIPDFAVRQTGMHLHNWIPAKHGTLIDNGRGKPGRHAMSPTGNVPRATGAKGANRAQARRVRPDKPIHHMQ